MDDQFLTAYKHGVVVDCSDGVKRRLYPRIFTYSADYPERLVRDHSSIPPNYSMLMPTSSVTLTTIRDFGLCPCPLCLVEKSDIRKMGLVADMSARVKRARIDSTARRRKVELSRKIIYDRGCAVNHNSVETLLKAESLVPTRVSHKPLEIRSQQP